MTRWLRRQAFIVGWSSTAAGSAFAYGVVASSAGPMSESQGIALVAGCLLFLITIAAPFELTERGRRLTAAALRRIG